MSDGHSIVFLDRDGTLNVDHGYVTSPKDIELIPGAAFAVANLKQAGFVVIVVTNQSAIGRGFATAEDVDRCNEELQRQLLRDNPLATLDEIVYSPYTPEAESDCRKPKTGMLKMLKSPLAINPQKSWVVGDKLSDLEFGINLGISENRCLLVLTGHGREELEKAEKESSLPKQVVNNLIEAVHIILEEQIKT